MEYDDAVDHLGLRPVHLPAVGEPTIDIIAVPGKGAHPSRTWTTLREQGLNPRDNANYVDWLQDDQMLPAAFPTARILRYGYPSEWFGANALATRAASIGERLLDDLTSLRLGAIERPIIFIAHSFGGLVVLKCMLLAKQENWKWPGIHDSIAGLVFLGTPFRGTHDKLHTEVLHSAELLFKGSELMYENHRASKADNDWLRDLVDDFFRLLRQSDRMPKIACFYEQKATDLGMLLKNKADYLYEPGKLEVMHVDETSACLDRTSRSIEKYARACGHFAMNKYASPTHPEWLTLRRVLTEMGEQETPHSPALFPVLSLASQAAFDAQNKQDETDCLPGTRTEILDAIWNWVMAADSPSVFWLNGSAGAGKSTIARTISRRLHGNSLLGASFFFSRDGGETLSGARLLYTTIANQLSRAGPAALRYQIQNASQNNRDILDKSRTFQWTTLILNPLKLASTGGIKVIRAIVIDALDECNDENDIRGLIPLLARVAEVTDYHIRILVISRPDPPIRDGFADIEMTTARTLSLDEQDTESVNNDIRLYLIDRFQRIKQKQSIRVHDWPETRSISRLVRLAAGLFIYAATACDFVQDDIDRPADISLIWFLDEMERIELQTPRSPSDDNDADMEHTTHLDRMYTIILQNALREGKDEKKRDRISAYLKDLLGALVTLQEPMAAGALQRLREVKNEDVRWRLNRLHSVIRVPQTDDTPLRLSHIAFRDFLIDARRCQDLRFTLAPHVDHQRLSQNCLRVLDKGLRQDVCKIEHPAASVRMVESNTIDTVLPEWVRYACRSWVSHITLSESSDIAVSAYHFLQRHLLHWLEAMAWIGKAQESTHMLGTLCHKFEGAHGDLLLEALLFFKDAHRFALFGHTILEEAPLQLYCSALLFAPRSSLVRKHFRNEICSWIDECGNRSAEWDDCLEMLVTPFNAGTMALSNDVKLVASANDDGSIHIWNRSNSDTVDLAGLPRNAEALAFSPDGKMLAACCQMYACGIWDATSGRLRWAVDLGMVIHTLMFSNYGLTVVIAGSRRIHPDTNMKELVFVFWDVSTGTTVEREGLPIASTPEQAKISPDLAYAALTYRKTITLVSVPQANRKSTRYVLEGHETVVGGASFSPDCKLVVTTCLRSVRVWSVATGDCTLLIPTGFLGYDSTPPPPPMISPDGRRIAARYRKASLSENYIGLWSIEDGRAQKEFAMKFTFSDFAGGFAPNSESLTVISTGEGRRPVLRTWDIMAAPETGTTAKLNHKTPSTTAFSATKQLVAISFTDGSLEVWATPENSTVATHIVSLQEESDFVPISNMWYSRNGERLAYERTVSTESSDPVGNVRVRDTGTGEALPPSSWADEVMAGIHIGSYSDGFRRVELEHSPEAMSLTVPIAGSWLCFDSEPILLLPSQCQLHQNFTQNGLVAGEGDFAVLAFARGRFSRLRFHREVMKSFMGKDLHIPRLIQREKAVPMHWATDGKR